jgi:alkylhydroperoxidase/carboxymuconolactone decarboxylase family protein YurZ
MSKIPKQFQNFTKNNPEITAAYENLSAACRRGGPLNEREYALVKIGIAAGSHLEGAVHSQVSKALDKGLRPDEIRHAIMLSIPTIGFPRMMAALTWANDIIERE